MSFLGYKIVKLNNHKKKKNKYTSKFTKKYDILYAIIYKHTVLGMYAFTLSKEESILTFVDKKIDNNIPKSTLAILEKNLIKELQIYLSLGEYSKVIWNKKEIKPIYIKIRKKEIPLSLATILTWSIIGITGTIVGIFYNISFIIPYIWIIAVLASILLSYLIINKNSV